MTENKRVYEIGTLQDIGERLSKIDGNLIGWTLANMFPTEYLANNPDIYDDLSDGDFLDYYDKQWYDSSNEYRLVVTERCDEAFSDEVFVTEFKYHARSDKQALDIYELFHVLYSDTTFEQVKGNANDPVTRVDIKQIKDANGTWYATRADVTIDGWLVIENIQLTNGTIKLSNRPLISFSTCKITDDKRFKAIERRVLKAYDEAVKTGKFTVVNELDM